MGKKRKKEKAEKLSRKKKKQARKEEESIVSEKPSLTAQTEIPEDSPEKIHEPEPVDEVIESDREEDLSEEFPDQPIKAIEEKEPESEPVTEGKTWQEKNLPLHLTAGFVFLLFTVVAFIIYAPAIKGPFIFDDKPNILESQAIRMTDFSFSGLQKAASEGRLRTRPVANVSFALNYLIHEYNVQGYHIFNIIIHAINGLLLFFLFRLSLNLIKPTGKQNIAANAVPFTAALIWLVHPLQSQSVAYVVQRMNSMAAMFYILAILLYALARLAGKNKSKYLLFGGCFVSGLLAFGTKENSATLPVFIFLFEWFFFQNLDFKWLKQKMYYIFIVLIISAAITFWVLGDDPMNRIFSGYIIRDFTPEQRVLTKFRVIFFYISQLIFPHPSRLSLEHDFPLSYSIADPPITILAIGAMLFILGLAIFFARKHRLVSFAVLWYFGNLFIESSFMPLELIFEHRSYIPSMYPILAVTVLAAKFIRMDKLKIAISCLLIVVLSFWTFERSRAWGDDELLNRDNVAKAPNKSRMYTNLANVLIKKGNLDEALENYYTALRLNPNDEKAYLGIGNTLNYQSKYDEAIKNFNLALIKNAGAYKIVTFQAYFGLGFAHARKWNSEKAIYYYKIALQVDPTSDKARAQLQKTENMLRAQKAREGK
jgi:hypothetical protein